MYNIYLKCILFFKNRKPNKGKGFILGTPVIVKDTRTSKILVFRSISEAARYFNTYPKTIWRIVYGDKLYLDRYKIRVKNDKVYDKISNKGLSPINFFKYSYKWIKGNYSLIFNVLLSIILIAIFYISIKYLILAYKEIYSNYISTIHNIRVNHPNLMLQYSFSLESNLKCNHKLNVTIVKTSKFVEENKDWLLKVNRSIYLPIMNKVDLDFNSGANISLMNTINLGNSSPIIERIDLNNVFNAMVLNTAPIIDTMGNNSLSINSNRNSLRLNTSIDLLGGQSRNKELLNYQSNILYLLINNLSPSIY